MVLTGWIFVGMAVLVAVATLWLVFSAAKDSASGPMGMGGVLLAGLGIAGVSGLVGIVVLIIASIL